MKRRRDSFALDGVPSTILDWFGKTHPRDHDLSAYESLLGIPMPRDLVRWGPPDPPPGTIHLPSASRLLAEKSPFEAALGACRMPSAFLQLLSACFHIAPIPAEGDVLFVHIPQGAGAPAQLVAYSHEEDFFTGPLAMDLPSGLFFVDVHDRWHRKKATEKKLAKELSMLAGRLGSGFPFSSWRTRMAREGGDAIADAIRAMDAAPAVDFTTSSLTVFGARSAWLAELFTRGTTYGVPSLGLKDAERALLNPLFPHYAPIGLYWLLSGWAGGDDALARAAMEKIEAGSRSPLMRDAAKLIGELLAGRKDVGRFEAAALREAVAASRTREARGA